MGKHRDYEDGFSGRDSKYCIPGDFCAQATQAGQPSRPSLGDYDLQVIADQHSNTIMEMAGRSLSKEGHRSYYLKHSLKNWNRDVSFQSSSTFSLARHIFTPQRIPLATWKDYKVILHQAI